MWLITWVYFNGETRSFTADTAEKSHHSISSRNWVGLLDLPSLYVAEWVSTSRPEYIHYIICVRQ